MSLAPRDAACWNTAFWIRTIGEKSVDGLDGRETVRSINAGSCDMETPSRKGAKGKAIIEDQRNYCYGWEDCFLSYKSKENLESARATRAVRPSQVHVGGRHCPRHEQVLVWSAHAGRSGAHDVRLDSGRQAGPRGLRRHGTPECSQ